VRVTPSVSITPSVTPSITVTISPSASSGIPVTPTASPSVTPSVSITPTPTGTNIDHPVAEVSITPSVTITPSITPSTSTGAAGCIYYATKTLTNFKNTVPDAGEILYLISSSETVGVCDKAIGVNISVVDCSFTTRLDSVSNLTEIEIEGNSFPVVRPGIAYEGYYYYELGSDPDYPCETLLPNSGNPTFPCNATRVYPEPVQLEFKTDEYNAVFGNAIQLRRIQRTGSIDSNYGGVFELDKRADQITPQNLEAVLNGTAVTASFQESNIYSKAWTSGRYDGTKLTSGSLFFNDPALTFTAFKGVKFPILESSSFIRSQSYADLDVEDFYFNPPYSYTKGAYEQGSTIAYPPSSQPIYELDGKDFKRITKSKIYLPGTGDILVLRDYQVVYEVTPGYTALLTDNIFYVNISTTANSVVYGYYNTSNGGNTGNYLSPGPGDNIYVSGSYISSLDRYVLDAQSSTRALNAVYTGGGPGLDNKTILTLLSSSRNIP
jgi:hypothetical protein